MKQQSGFTLIELITIVVILGILAATALPKFANLSADARVAKMAGIAASLKEAAAMAHGQQLTEAGLGLLTGQSGSSAVTLDGGQIIAMSNFYPEASGIQLGIASAIDTTGYAISGLSNAAGIIYFYPDTTHLTANTCYVTYTAAIGDGGGHLLTAPVINLTNASTVTACE